MTDNSFSDRMRETLNEFKKRQKELRRDQFELGQRHINANSINNGDPNRHDWRRLNYQSLDGWEDPRNILQYADVMNTEELKKYIGAMHEGEYLFRLDSKEEINAVRERVEKDLHDTDLIKIWNQRFPNNGIYGGGKMKQKIVYKKREYIVNIDKSTKRKYITCNKQKVFLGDIRGDYKPLK